MLAQVSAGWQAVHDALVMRLVFRRKTNDEAVGMVVRRFPVVVSVQVCRFEGRLVTDMGVKAVSSIRALTSLNLFFITLYLARLTLHANTHAALHPPTRTPSASL